MNENSLKKESNIKSAIDAATDLVKAIPIYQDTIQPSAKQIGKSLETITRTVNIALAPIKALVWGYEKIEQFITTSVSEKLKNIPPENIATPPLQVAGPTIEALRYTGHDKNLRELFANLLATSMDVTTLKEAHPGYVEIIKNLCSDEAALIRVFILSDTFPIIHANTVPNENSGNGGMTLTFPNFSHLHKLVPILYPELLPSYLSNLCRLGVLETPMNVHLIATDRYTPLENDSIWKPIRQQAAEKNSKIIFQKGIVRLTTYGKQFLENVVISKDFI